MLLKKTKFPQRPCSFNAIQLHQSKFINRSIQLLKKWQVELAKCPWEQNKFSQLFEISNRSGLNVNVLRDIFKKQSFYFPFYSK